MTFESSKNMGGIGAILLVVGTLVPFFAGIYGWIIDLIGAVRDTDSSELRVVRRVHRGLSLFPEKILERTLSENDCPLIRDGGLTVPNRRLSDDNHYWFSTDVDCYVATGDRLLPDTFTTSAANARAASGSTVKAKLCILPFFMPH
jgi:hypothetical protein